MKRRIVLLVEDSPDDLELIRIAVKEMSNPFELVAVSDGQEALDWMLSQGNHAGREDQLSLALILLDLKLPVLDGLEVMQALRSHPTQQFVPVVVLTTSEMPKDIARAYECGANAYLQKPMGLSDLVGLLESIERFWLSFNVLHPAVR